MATKAMADIKDTSLLGGFATGCLKLTHTMSTELSGLVKSSVKEYTDKTPANKNPLSFIVGVKLEGEDRFKSAVLGGYDKSVPGVAPSCFKQSFPFTHVEFPEKRLKNISVSLTAFNPCIIHNPIDSAIPAVFFEFTFTNNSDKNAMVSLCSVLKSFFSLGRSTFGYNPVSETSYIALTETSKGVASRRRGNFCLATSSTDFTYEIDGDESLSFFYKKFCRHDGFLSDDGGIGSFSGVKNISAALSCHAKIPPGATNTIKLVCSWCFPYCGDGLVGSAEKNYYSHYFQDSLNCVVYSISHFDRLKRESIALNDMIYKTNLPQRAKDILGNYLKGIKSPYILRDGGGLLMNIPECDTECCLAPFSFALEYLFPGITRLTTVKSIRNLIYAKSKSPESGEFLPFAYETDCMPEQIYSRLMLILRLYRIYRSSSDLKFFSENWVDIACMADMLCKTAFNTQMTGETLVMVYSAVVCTLHSCIHVSDVLVDKKRSMYFLNMYNHAKSVLVDYAGKNTKEYAAQILKAQYLAFYACGLKIYNDEITKKAADAVNSADGKTDFFTCAALILYGHYGKAQEIIDELISKKIAGYEGELYEKATQCAVLFTAYTGFDYDKNSMTISFKMVDELSDEYKTFRGFISFDEAYGFVEQGVDYIEILLLSGEIKVKNFISPHKPYTALYGGRTWSSEIIGNTVIMDNNMIVSKKKKLTLFIDLTK